MASSTRDSALTVTMARPASNSTDSTGLPLRESRLDQSPDESHDTGTDCGVRENFSHAEGSRGNRRPDHGNDPGEYAETDELLPSPGRSR